MFRLLLVALLAVLLAQAQLKADIIYESASLGATGQTFGGGSAFMGTSPPDVFQGARFQISEIVNVTSVGGHLGTFGTFFAAIVELSGPSSLPSGSPFDLTTIAYTTFNAGTPSRDFRTPLNVVLSPGYYALIFGANYYGAQSTIGFMPTNNLDLPGSSYISYSSPYLSMPGGWGGSSWSNMRFVVEGTSEPVPEPVSFVFVASAIAALGIFRRHGTV